jgi:hypothetical protein
MVTGMGLPLAKGAREALSGKASHIDAVRRN